MSHCDNFISDDNNRFTYVNDALGHKSCIDHVFVTQSLVPDIQKYDVLDLANNFNDHRPISIVFDLPFSHAADNVANNNSKHFAVRWDKCDLEAYYEATRVHCSEIFY